MGFLVPKLPKAPKKKFWKKNKSKARKLAKSNSEPLKPANFLKEKCKNFFETRLNPTKLQRAWKNILFLPGNSTSKGRTILCNNDLTLKVTNFIFDTLILFSQAALRTSSPQEIHNAQIHKLFQQIRDLKLQMIAGFIPCLLATLSHT